MSNSRHTPVQLLFPIVRAMLAARQTHETIECLNNLAIAGGALLVTLNGSGPWSVDALFTKGEGNSFSPLLHSEPA